MRFRRLYALKRFLSIFSDLIFDSKVDPGMPSLAAAPEVPDIGARWSAAFTYQNPDSRGRPGRWASRR